MGEDLEALRARWSSLTWERVGSVIIGSARPHDTSIVTVFPHLRVRWQAIGQGSVGNGDAPVAAVEAWLEAHPVVGMVRGEG